MKTALLLRKAFKHALFFLLLFGTSITLFAQCPTITDSNPPPICDASGFTFNDLSATYAIDAGNGIVWYDADTGGNPFNGSQRVFEGVYYIDDNSGNCGSPRASITIDFQVDASGLNLDRLYCSNDNASIQTYIDDVLQASIPSGGSVEVYNDFALTDQANPSDAIPGGASNYFIVFVDNGGCKSQLEIGQVGIFSAPADPTPNTPQSFCSDSNPTIGDLDPGTTATNYNWYANVDGFGDPIPPALPLSTPLSDGNTYYIQINDVFCNSNAVAVSVEVNDPVDAGNSATLDYCNDNLPAPFNLFDELGGTPDTTGNWSGPVVTSNGHLGTVDISSLTTADTYVFTYTVLSNNTCPNETSTVSITVYETLSSGAPSASNPASFCVSGLPTDFDLFSLIENYDTGGQWTQGTSSSDPIVTSTIDLTSFTPATYNFTYTQNLSPSPCTEESTTVQVIVLADPNAGTANNQQFCENDLAVNSPYDLFDALNTPYDGGGTWTDSSNNTVSNPINIKTFTATGSPYQFTYTVDNGTCTDDETISITVLPAPESGTANAPAEFCEGAAPASFDLYSLISGESGTGTWTDNTTSTTVADPTNVDLSGYNANTYSFTFDIDPIGSCDDANVTVSVIINPLPNTGTPSNVAFCENDLAANSPLDLFAQLLGEDAGGSWSDDNTSGALSGSDVDLTKLGIGSYNFTYSITDANGCSNSSTVTVTVNDAPESGTANAPAEFCEGAAPASFDLYSLITGESGTGTWTDNTTSTTVADPTNVDLSGYTANTYSFTFDIDPIGSCDDANVTVSIIINPLPNTGTPSNVAFCENDLSANSPLDLFAQLSGEDAGGTWNDDNTSGALSGSDVDLTTLAIGSYNFTYSITDTNGCSNSSTVTITVNDAPESGTANAPAEFCLSEITTGQTYNLFDLLTGEDQSGTWNDDDASGALSGNIIALDALTQGSYNFTYDVDAIGSCDDVNVTVTIIINDTFAPTAASPQEFCDSATVADLVATGDNIRWYDAATDGNLLQSSDALVNGGTYYASQTDPVKNCESATRTAVNVNIYNSPNAGNPNGTALIVCSTDNNIDLFAGLDGSQDAGGTWSNDDNVGSLLGNIFNATGLFAGTYSFTYTVSGTSPCADDSTVISVTVEEPFNAGTDGSPLELCSNNGSVNLFDYLNGNPDTGGTWSPALTSGTGVFDPLVDAPGTYSYSFTNACGTASSNIDVSVTLAPNAGADASAALCVIDGPIDLFTLLGSGAQSGGTWSPALASGTGVFDPAVDTSGDYTYTVTAESPCSPDAEAIVSVTVNDSPAIIVNDANPSFCLVDNPTVADLSIAIRPSGTVNWYEDASLTLPLTGTEALTDGEDYYATQTTTSGCESSVAVQIVATVNDAPTPTLEDASEDYCINDNPTILDLSNNILEYDSNADNVVWYDAATGGSALSESEILTNMTYYAALIDASTGCESSTRLAVTPDVTACGKVNLPDGFSPNGDGVNDTYDVDNLALLYPNFEIEIFNRNGNVVYKGNANSPRFDGTSNQSRVVSKGKLPVGVYFYIFKFNDGENQPEQGRLYLSR